MNESYFRELGFQGFKPVDQLITSGRSEVPSRRGIYVVLRTGQDSARFLTTNVGGHFKGKDPTVPAAVLSAKWVPDAELVYVGCAGRGGSDATLIERIGALLKFGAGAPVGHWGGRYLWQLADNRSLLVAWKAIDSGDPSIPEQEIIDSFKLHYSGRLPFANLVNSRRGSDR